MSASENRRSPCSFTSVCARSRARKFRNRCGDGFPSGPIMDASNASRSAPDSPRIRTRPPHSGTSTSSYGRSCAARIWSLVSSIMPPYSKFSLSANHGGRLFELRCRPKHRLTGESERERCLSLVIKWGFHLKSRQERFELPRGVVGVREHDAVSPHRVVEIVKQGIVNPRHIVHVNRDFTGVFQTADEFSPTIRRVVACYLDLFTFRTRTGNRRNICHV